MILQIPDQLPQTLFLLFKTYLNGSNLPFDKNRRFKPSIFTFVPATYEATYFFRYLHYIYSFRYSYRLKRRMSNHLQNIRLPLRGISREQKHGYGQSCAIARFAAKKAGLYPKDDFEMLVTDGVVDSWRDTLDIFYETVFARAVVGGRLMMLPHPQSLKVRKLSLFLSYELEEQCLDTTGC